MWVQPLKLSEEQCREKPFAAVVINSFSEVLEKLNEFCSEISVSLNSDTERKTMLISNNF